MTWRHLSLAEGRQALRLLERLGRRNPLLMTLLVFGAGAVLWLSILAGRAMATITPAPAGLMVATALVAAGTLLAGLVSALAAPGVEEIDDQIAAAPLSRIQFFLGVAGVPLFTTWLILTLPTLLFGFGLYSSLDVSAAPRSATILAATQLVAAVAGGTVGSLIRRLRRGGASRVNSRGMGPGLPATTVKWLALSGWRDAKVRDQAILTIAFGFACLGLLALSQQGSLLVPFAVLILIVATGSVPLLLSGAFIEGSWLWRMLPVPAWRVGMAWWLAATLTTSVLVILAILPLGLAFRRDFPFLVLAVVIAAPVPGAVGRLVPWRSDSLLVQLGSGVVLAASYGSALALILGVMGTFGRAAGRWGALFGLCSAVALVYGAGALLCAAPIRTLAPEATTGDERVCGRHP